ncbi:MAG: PspC domain-containing protein [Bacteroidales bacterium]|nr:PspC domain-containing protein [Bacteroidales bacterium]
MTEIEKVSIGGYAFTLEKAAAEEVGQYLKNLEAHYLGKPGGKEIMEGIEERMAELLLERCGRGRVATMADIQSLIGILGRPERIEADDPEPSEAQAKPQKKLYRDLENKKIAGVCAGLGNYFNFDVVAMRIIFCVITLALFFTGADEGVWSLSGFAAYAILWLAMPAARTAQERWAMKGDAGTLNDIQRNIRSGVEEMGDAARRGMNEVRDTVRGHGNEIGKILLLVIGIILLLGGVSGLASVSVLGLKGPTLFSAPLDRFLDDMSVNVPIFYDMVNTPWIMVLAILAVVLPLIGLIYGGIQLIFGFKPPKWRPGLVIFVLWLVVLVVLAVLFAMGVVSTEYLHV